MYVFPEDQPFPRMNPSADPHDQNDEDLELDPSEEQPSAGEESGDDLEEEIPGTSW